MTCQKKVCVEQATLAYSLFFSLVACVGKGYQAVKITFLKREYDSGVKNLISGALIAWRKKQSDRTCPTVIITDK